MDIRWHYESSWDTLFANEVGILPAREHTLQKNEDVYSTPEKV
ncbi:hypothetical protein BSG1_21485 [Bacillus sp. SG-1]|nr:hypothetical protein BSG1_21485 [Bacillus sp. SG-1]